jgi:hypothetical protein
VSAAHYPVTVDVRPALEERNRLTTFFRFFLALPHIFLVGGPAAIMSSVGWGTDGSWSWGGSAGGFLGLLVVCGAIVSWFVLVLTARHPGALWRFGAWYLRWRVRAMAYVTLLRDDYPPFGDGDYPVALDVARPTEPRDRVTVGLRLLLVMPHLIALMVLSLIWAFTTAVAWVVILFTGRYPETLYGFALGVLAWNMRVEAYLLLLRDEYPPFDLRA